MPIPFALQSRPAVTPTLVIRPLPHAGKTRHLAVWYPPGYQSGSRTSWPLVVFLHGRGECGTEGSRQTAVGLIAAAQLNPARWPAIIIAPQKQGAEVQWVQDDDYVTACIDAVLAEHTIDTSRIYLTGLSQGGAGTWAIAAKHPERFAAIAPVCGYGDPAAVADKLTGLPIWAFHGLKDTVVPAVQSQSMVEAIMQRRASVVSPAPAPKLTLFPEADHNAWDPAYRATGDDDLWQWLSTFERKLP